MVKRKRNYNCRLIKATWPYTIQEIAARLGVHKNAVSRWLSQGLHADRSQRPFLIRGENLIRFLSDRQQRRKRKSGPTEFYCFRCREAREAYERVVDILALSASKLLVKGRCDVCGASISKIQSTRNLEKIRAAFYVQQQERLHLVECSVPGVNGDLEVHK